MKSALLSKRRGFGLVPLTSCKDCSSKTLSVPSLSKEYELLEVLGKGGYATVKRAVRRRDGTEFAAKISHCSDYELRRTALEEHRILSYLNHENIIGVVALHEDDRSNEVCLVLEYCALGSVHGYIHKFGPLQAKDSSELMKGCIRGIDYLHSSRFVHRDLKPQNLLLQGDRLGSLILKIADFGCAKQLGNNTSSSLMLTDRGSNAYVAPEVMLSLCFNERIDIWAFGFCSYYMLKGRIPFDIWEPAFAETLERGGLPKICWEGISCLMKDFIRHCLTVKMENRPAAVELCLSPMFEDVIVRTVSCPTLEVPNSEPLSPTKLVRRVLLSQQIRTAPFFKAARVHSRSAQ